MANCENIHFLPLFTTVPLAALIGLLTKKIQSALKFLPEEAWGIIHQNNTNFQTVAKLTPGEFGMQLSNLHPQP